MAGALGMALAAGCDRIDQHDHPSARTPVLSVSPGSPLDDDIGTPYTPGAALLAAPDRATSTAAAFAEAWARPTLSAGDWWVGVAPLCDPGLADRFRVTDPANVPATTITGPPVPAEPATADAARFSVPTDAGALTVVVINTPQGWRVAGVDFTASVR